MRRPRFTIAGILGFVVLLAVGLAALREATDLWVSGVFAATLGALTVSVLLAVHRRERRRAFWLGFALFGGVYLGASLVPALESRLPTTRGLAYLDAKLSARETTVTLPLAVPAGNANTDLVLRAVNSTVNVNGPGSIGLWSAVTGTPASGTAENFVRIGHSLLALVAGVLGGLLSRRLHESNQGNGPADSPRSIA